ncbi:hypothetical protein JF531_01775 [Microbacterium esteraromaticum]|uniref:hypothetical protein n=1 Tax=Microbacterium esteraromaticum TaxID=57043 RepID=UPI001A8E0625|nr:hypothetical protein [Microbacterium esteraromaticum]MBN8423246.1 hypothetical protein [Microbacterium esteraromaticum]
MPFGGELGIRSGEIWAYRQRTTHPLQRAFILNPGHSYDASIRIRLIDNRDVAELWTARAKLPCKWAYVEDYLLKHPDVPREYPPPSEPEDRDMASYRMSFSANELRAVIHDEVSKALGVQKIAYTRTEEAIATGVSVSMIDTAVKRNELIANYAGTKPLFLADELRRWVSTLPEDPWRIIYR